MKQKVYSRKYLFISHVISFLISPFYIFINFFQKRYNIENLEIKKILILEYHRIGDVIIILPVLRSIKQKFPKSKLILICCKESYDLIKHFNVVDKVVPVEIPWTNWDFSIYKLLKTYSLIKKLKSYNIDLAFDFKGDLRNNWFLWKIKPKLSFGYNATGGSFFLTNSFKFDHEKHQKDRADQLISKVGCIPINTEKNLNVNNNGLIVIHPGCSNIKMSWSSKKWIKLIKLLSKDYNLAIVKIPESLEIIEALNDKLDNLEIFESDIVGFKLWLQKQTLLIGVDSMAGHLAAEIGIPSISIFGSQDSRLTSPRGKASLIIEPSVKCKHYRSHWRLCFFCINEISEESVCSLTKKLLNKIKNNKNSV